MWAVSFSSLGILIGVCLGSIGPFLLGNWITATIPIPVKIGIYFKPIFEAIIYGLVTARSVISADAGSEKMQEISGAVQAGAYAYLNRQYRTILIVGVVIFIGGRTIRVSRLVSGLVSFDTMQWA